MNSRQLCLTIAATYMLATLTGTALADTLRVTSTASMGGSSGSTCSGNGMPGPCGLEITHNNTSPAYVEDLSPDNESVYRIEFLFRIHSMNTTANFRQQILTGIGLNPNPGAGVCGNFVYSNPFTCFEYQTGGIGQIANLQCFVRGNLCGDSATARIPISVGQSYRVCIEWEAGSSLTGRIALGVVDAASPCPPSGDPAYVERTTTNNLMRIDRIRLGTPAPNAFGAGETAIYHFDEYSAFTSIEP